MYRKIFTLVIISLIFPVEASKIGTIDSTSVILPHAGSSALEFGMSGLFNLGAYMGNTIAYKKYKSSNKAIRYTLNIVLNGTTEEGSGKEWEYSPYNGDSTVFVLDYDTKRANQNHEILFIAQWIKYEKPSGMVSLFYGYGPIVGISNSHSVSSFDPTNSTYNPYDGKLVRNSTIIYTGIAPLIGIEWFAHQNFSFHAEYQCKMKIGWRMDEEKENRDYYDGGWYRNETESSGIYYQVIGATKIGISFYFK